MRVSIVFTASTASPSAAPGARLKLSEIAGNCAWCEIASGAVVRFSVATAIERHLRVGRAATELLAPPGR